MPNTPPNITKYISDGLTLVSNNPSVMKRDDRGNIMLESGSTNNQPIIIETNYNSYTNASFVKVADTTFNYYKFPSTRFQPNIDVEFPDISDNLDIIGNVLDARYTLPFKGDVNGVDNDLVKVNTSYESSWYTDGAITVDGGFRRIPFVGSNQVEEGSYTLTPKIIKLLRDGNKTLKFEFMCLYVNSIIGTNPGYLPYSGIRIRVDRETPTRWRSSLPNSTFYTTSAESISNIQTYPFFRFQYVLDMNDVYDYDKFKIQTETGNGMYMSIEQSYWIITTIDIGSEPIGFSNFEGRVGRRITLNNNDGQQVWP